MTDDRDFWPSLVKALYFTAIYMPFMLGSAILFASVISRVKNIAVAAFFRTIMYLPVILPTAVAVLMWKTLLGNQTGYVNHILRNVISMPQLAMDWINNPASALPVVAVTRIWKDAGYAAMLFLIGMYGINDELYEAAAIDGASSFQQWRSITIPLLKPVITLVLVLNANLISAAQDFMIMYGAGNFGPQGSCKTLGYYIWMVAFRWGDLRMGYAAAMSLFLGIVSAILAGIVFKLLRTERA
jgi:ABC-type sugar transport system permease subunit